MNVILDESSLVPCDCWSPAQRIQIMASALKELDQLGCRRVLRSVRTAADQDIGQGGGLRRWCFDRGTNREAGKFIAQRLGKQPFIDGGDGLFAATEGDRAIEGSVLGDTVIGLAFAAITGNPCVALASAALPSCASVAVDLTTLDAEGDIQEIVKVCRIVTKDDVLQQSGPISNNIVSSVADGKQLLERAQELFPRLCFGPRAMEQISALRGNETVFHQLFRHLRALDQGANLWPLGIPYSPTGAITWSSESNATLRHKNHGPLRDFPMPDGFAPRRWSDHTKLSGGAGTRLYFYAARTGEKAVVLIGYFGNHLPTVNFSG